MEIDKVTFGRLAETKGVENSFDDLDVNKDGVINDEDTNIASADVRQDILNILSSDDVDEVNSDMDFDIDKLDNVSANGENGSTDDIDWSKLMVDGKGINLANLAKLLFQTETKIANFRTFKDMMYNITSCIMQQGTQEEKDAIQQFNSFLTKLSWREKTLMTIFTSEADAIMKLARFDQNGDGFISDEDIEQADTTWSYKNTTTINGKKCYLYGTMIITENEFQKLDEYFTKNGENASLKGAYEAMGISDYANDEYSGSLGALLNGLPNKYRHFSSQHSSFTGEAGVKSTTEEGGSILYAYRIIKLMKEQGRFPATVNTAVDVCEEASASDIKITDTNKTSSSSVAASLTQFEIDKLNDEQEEIQNDIESKQKEIKTKQKKIEAKQKELEDLVKNAQNNNDNSQASYIAELQSEIKVLSSEIDGLQSGIDQLQSDYSTNQIKLTALSAQLEAQQTSTVESITRVNAVETINGVTSADEVSSCCQTSDSQDIFSQISKTELELLKLMNINLSGCFIGKSKDGQYHVYRKGGGNIPLVARVNSYTDNAGVQNYLYNLGVVPGADGCTYSNEEYPAKTRGLAKIYQEFGIEQYHAVSTTVGWRTDYSNTELDYSEPTYSIDSINNDWTNVKLTEKKPSQISESDLGKYLSKDELELCLSSYIMGNMNMAGYSIESLSDCYITKGGDGKYHLYQKSTGQPVLYYQAVTNISIENPIGKRAIEALGLSATDTSDWRKVMPDGNSEIITIKT